jgi:hypothetical protein
MQTLQALRKFNTVALSIFLILAMAVASFAFVQLWRSNSFDDYGPGNAETRDPNEIAGRRIHVDDRILTLYRRTTAGDDFETDLRFVDAGTGETTTLGRDPKQQMYGETVMGSLRRDEQDSGYGYLAKAKSGELNGQLLFDVLFLRFADMRTFTVASNVLAFDETELDNKSFSAVTWDKEDRAHFVLFDAQQGKVTITKDLDMRGARKTKTDIAPVNRF